MSATTTTITTTTSHHHTLPEGLAPDSVDTLTELTSILTRFRASQAPSSSSSQPHASTSQPGAISSVAPGIGGGGGGAPTPLPGAVTGTTPLPSGAPNTVAGGQALSIKELPTATDNLKHKLQRARGAMRTLEDVQRASSQQEDEINRLEERRKKQAAMLARIQDEGIQFARSNGDGDGDRMEE